MRIEQDDLAALLGVHTMTVSRWERGVRVPSRAHVEEIARLAWEMTGWIPRRWFYLDSEEGQ